MLLDPADSKEMQLQLFLEKQQYHHHHQKQQQKAKMSKKYVFVHDCTHKDGLTYLRGGC